MRSYASLLANSESRVAWSARCLAARRAFLLCAVALAVTTTESLARGELVLYQLNKKLTATPDGPNQQFDLDVDNNGVGDFLFTTIIADLDERTLASFTDVKFRFGTSNSVVIDALGAGGFPAVTRATVGDSVGPESLFAGPNDSGNLFFVTSLDPPSGNFEGQTGFAGLRFEGAGGTHYGYAQLTLNTLQATTDPLSLTIGLVGYESVPGQGVTIVVPEPAGLTMCGLGLAILLWGRNAARKRCEST